MSCYPLSHAWMDLADNLFITCVLAGWLVQRVKQLLRRRDHAVDLNAGGKDE